jgi:hypothetical protein
MKRAWWSAVAVAALIGADAHAVQTASDFAEAWAARAGCRDGLVAIHASQTGTILNVDANGDLRLAQVQIRVDGDRLSIIDEEKIEYYLIVGADRVEYMGFDQRAPGGAAAQPASWSYCG